METIIALLDGISLIAQALGFVALYAIAIAMFDWRKMERIKNKSQKSILRFDNDPTLTMYNDEDDWEQERPRRN